MTSSIQANDNDTSKFLDALETICAQQTTICRQLDELLLLMQMPSESVLKVLHGLLLPMGRDMAQVTAELKNQLPET